MDKYQERQKAEREKEEKAVLKKVSHQANVSHKRVFSDLKV